MLSRFENWLFRRTGYWRGRFYGRGPYDDYTRIAPGRGWGDAPRDSDG